jgi:branched-chain amino acid transport system ATP-binding protein
MLKVNDINVYYGNIHALKGVSLEINQGEIVTLIGANGAGKSTLLQTISGLLKPKNGEVLFEGEHVAGKVPQLIVNPQSRSSASASPRPQPRSSTGPGTPCR